MLSKKLFLKTTCSSLIRNTLIQRRTKYSDKLLQHSGKPKNVGKFNENDKNVGTAVVGAPACGDVMKLQIKVDDDGIIVDSCFKTFGCVAAIGSSEYAAEKIKGMNIESAKKVKSIDISKELALPPVKLHCSLLVADAIQIATNNYKSKQLE